MNVRVTTQCVAMIVVAAAALLLARQQPDATDRNPIAGNPAAIAAGERIFQQTCVTCHGDPARAPSLANGTFAHGSQDADIFRTIRSGVSGTQMPPFAGLSAEQLWQLVSYIRTSAGRGADCGRWRQRACGDARIIGRRLGRRSDLLRKGGVLHLSRGQRPRRRRRARISRTPGTQRARGRCAPRF